MSRPPSTSSIAGAPLPPPSDAGKSPFQERAETFQRLEMTQKRKSQSETELQTLVRIRSNTPNMSPIEIGEADQTILGLRHQIGKMDYQIQDLVAKLERQETVIAQQQATIRTQSKAIENPRGSRPQYHASTPRHQGVAERQSYFDNSRAPGPPPPYNSPYGAYAHHPGGDGDPMWPSQYDLTMSVAPGTMTAPSMFAHGHMPQHPMGYHQRQSHQGIDDFGSPRIHPRPTTPVHRSNPSGTSMNMSMTPLHTTPSGENDPFGPIVPRTGRFNAQAPAFHPPQASVNSQHMPSHPAESPMSNPYPETSIQANQSTLTLADTLGAHDAAIAEQFDRVFASAKNWALNHANFPNTAGDNALSQDLKSRIIRAASMQTAFPLMKSQQTRYWLITKLIIQYLIKHVLRENTFSGLNQEADRGIDDLRQTIYQSTPTQIRCMILKNIAEKTQQIVDNPKYKEYVDHLTKQRAEKLFYDIRSLKHKATLRDQEDILLLVAEAHKLAELMNTSADEYAFNWADIGDRFDRFSMRNVCPRYGGCSDDNMRARWATVRLCATPEVVVRKNSMDSTQLNEVKLHRMRVLLKVKGDDRIDG